jgi:hypothetical protein
VIAASIVLASSPAIGPLTMTTLGRALAGRGIVVTEPPAHPDLGGYVAVAGAGQLPRPTVLVGFSAAGPRLFAVAAVLAPDAVVFMDARLPVDGVAPDAEPAFADLLDRLPVDDGGLLPPWPSWWPEPVLEVLVPDRSVRDAFVAECPQVPRAMFSVPVPAPEYHGPRAYLAFGDTYADQRSIADRRGWPVATLDRQRHLAPLVEPDTVAGALVDLIGRL